MKPLWLLSLSLVLAGCGASPLAPARGDRPAAVKASKRTPAAAPVALADLATTLDRPASEGKRVIIEATLVPYTYALGYGDTYHGYQLSDGQGRWVLARNLYTLRSLFNGMDATHDLSDAARKRLAREGVVVKVEGVYHPTTRGVSHGAVYTVPPSLEVTAIDAQPVAAFLAGRD